MVALNGTGVRYKPAMGFAVLIGFLSDVPLANTVGGGDGADRPWVSPLVFFGSRE